MKMMPHRAEGSAGNMVSGSRDDGPGLYVAENSSASDKRPVLVLNNRIDSRELFAASREVTITHGTEIYRLRLTSQNKLILTK